MNKAPEIFVPSGIKPVHLFDVWGVIIDAERKGKDELSNYVKAAEQLGIAPEARDVAMADYEALVRGDPKATGARKGEIIDAISGPLAKAGFESRFEDYVFQTTVEAMAEILDAKEGVSIYTSKPNKTILQALPKEIAERVGRVYFPKGFDKGKSDPRAFQYIKGLIALEETGVPVSHTADELPELKAAYDSKVLPGSHLFYVNRNDSNTREKVFEAGIQNYVADVKDIPYRTLVKRK